MWRSTVAPWWAKFLISLALLALASRMIVAQDQLAVAGAIVGYVAAHWLPAGARRSDERQGDIDGRPE